MRYFVKLVGLTEEPLPAEWWNGRPEIVDGIFFHQQPKAIAVGDRLIYYAVGRGCLCGVVEVLGLPSTNFVTSASWSAERRKRFPWRMPVKLLTKLPADHTAPKFSDFHRGRIGRGSYQFVEAAEAERMIAAIANPRSFQ